MRYIEPFKGAKIGEIAIKNLILSEEIKHWDEELLSLDTVVNIYEVEEECTNIRTGKISDNIYILNKGDVVVLLDNVVHELFEEDNKAYLKNKEGHWEELEIFDYLVFTEKKEIGKLNGYDVFTPLKDCILRGRMSTDYIYLTPNDVFIEDDSLRSVLCGNNIEELKILLKEKDDTSW